MRKIFILILLCLLTGCNKEFKPNVKQNVDTIEVNTVIDYKSIIYCNDSNYIVNIESNSINPYSIGEYSITFTVSNGNQKANVTYIVKVVDTVSPTITQISEISLPKNYDLEQFNPSIYLRANDKYDGDLTNNITYDKFSTKEVGTVLVTFFVKDNSGNKAELEIPITIYDDQPIHIEYDPDAYYFDGDPTSTSYLKLDKKKMRFTFISDDCQGTTIYVGEYEKEDDTLVLYIDDYPLDDTIPESSILDFKILSDDSLQYLSPYNKCKPFQNCIYSKVSE